MIVSPQSHREHRERLDRIYPRRVNRIYMMFAQENHGVHGVPKQASLFQLSFTPMSANAPHRLPPSSAFERTRHTVSSSPHSYRGIFEGMSKIHRLEGDRNLRSRFPRIGDHNARALGWSGKQEMGRVSLLTRTIWCYPRYLERLIGIPSILLILSKCFSLGTL